MNSDDALLLVLMTFMFTSMLYIGIIFPINGAVAETNTIVDCVKNTSLSIDLCESIVKDRYPTEGK